MEEVEAIRQEDPAEVQTSAIIFRVVTVTAAPAADFRTSQRVEVASPHLEHLAPPAPVSVTLSSAVTASVELIADFLMRVEPEVVADSARTKQPRPERPLQPVMPSLAESVLAETDADFPTRLSPPARVGAAEELTGAEGEAEVGSLLPEHLALPVAPAMPSSAVNAPVETNAGTPTRLVPPVDLVVVESAMPSREEIASVAKIASSLMLKLPIMAKSTSQIQFGMYLTSLLDNGLYWDMVI
jgi:hypothetical protein